MLTIDENNVYIMATKWQPTVADTVTEAATQVSTGKDSIGKVSIGECFETAEPSTQKNRGEYKNVILTEEEYGRFILKYPEGDRVIERLSRYMAATGKKYNSHYAVLCHWADKDKASQVQRSDDSSYDIDEFFELALKRSEDKMLGRSW